MISSPRIPSYPVGFPLSHEMAERQHQQHHYIELTHLGGFLIDFSCDLHGDFLTCYSGTLTGNETYHDVGNYMHDISILKWEGVAHCEHTERNGDGIHGVNENVARN